MLRPAEILRKEFMVSNRSLTRRLATCPFKFLISFDTADGSARNFRHVEGTVAEQRWEL